MAVQILNDQFRSFVSFAQEAIRNDADNGGKCVARLVEGGQERTFSIVRNTTDKAYAFFRSGDNKAENDRVREKFLNSVIQIFGRTIDDVPEVVLDALKMDDYDKGRPLTARRIAAVNEGVLMALNGASKSLNERMAIEKGVSNQDFLSQAKDAVKAGFGDSVLMRLGTRLTQILSDAGGSTSDLTKLGRIIDVIISTTYANTLASSGRDNAFGEALSSLEQEVGKLSDRNPSAGPQMKALVRDVTQQYVDLMVDRLEEKVQTAGPDVSAHVPTSLLQALRNPNARYVSRMVTSTDEFLTTVREKGAKLDEELAACKSIVKELMTSRFGAENADRLTERLLAEVKESVVLGWYGSTSPKVPSLKSCLVVIRDNPDLLDDLPLAQLLDDRTRDARPVGRELGNPGVLIAKMTSAFFNKQEIPKPFDADKAGVNSVFMAMIGALRDSPDVEQKKIDLQEVFDQTMAKIQKGFSAAGGEARAEKLFLRSIRNFFVNSASKLRPDEEVAKYVAGLRDSFVEADEVVAGTSVKLDDFISKFRGEWSKPLPKGAIKGLLNSAREYAKTAFKGFDGTPRDFVKRLIEMSRVCSIGTGHGVIDESQFDMVEPTVRSGVTNLFVWTALSFMDDQTRQALCTFAKTPAFLALSMGLSVNGFPNMEGRRDLQSSPYRTISAINTFFSTFNDVDLPINPTDTRVSGLGLDPMDLTLFNQDCLEGVEQDALDKYDIGVALYSKPHTTAELHELERNVAQWLDEGVSKDEILTRLA